MKEKFIKSTIILLVGGLITKILGMVIKIFMTRSLGDEGIGLYMLIIPTFSLFIGMAQFGMPIAFSKMVAEGRCNNKRLFSSALFIIFIINIIVISIIFLSAKYLSINLLHERRVYLSIFSMGFVVIFCSISSLCRSYFFGVEKILPHVISNIIEDIFRLIVMALFLKYFVNISLSIALAFIILSNIVSEIISTIVLILFLPKKIEIKYFIKKPNKCYVRELFNIGFYNTSSRLISSISYFLEPILLTNMLLINGYSSSYITMEYGVITGYSLPLLLLPSFFTLAISQALLPVVSREYSKGSYKSVRKKIKLCVFLSVLVGLCFTVLFEICPKFLLHFIYNTKRGSEYVRFLAPVCLFQYIQAPLSFSLDAMGKSAVNMKISIISAFFKNILLVLFSFFKIGIWALIFSTTLNIILNTLLCIKKVRQALQFN